MKRATKPSKRLLKKLPEEVDKLHQAYPEAQIELWRKARASHWPQTDPAPGLGKDREPSAGRGATALPVDVSVWLCATAERGNQLVAHAYGEYHSLFSRALCLCPGTEGRAKQAPTPGLGASGLAQTCRSQGSRRSPLALLAISFARVATGGALVAPLQRTTCQPGLGFAGRARTGPG
jgi:hypothetical protein